jgi:hypothetical protein
MLMFYKAIGFAVWKLAKAELRRRYVHLAKPGAAVATAAALAVVYVATRDRDSE